MDKTPVSLTIMHIALVAKVAKRRRKDELRRSATRETDSEARKHFFAFDGERLTSKGIHHSVTPDVRLVAYARSCRFYSKVLQLPVKCKSAGKPITPRRKGVTCYGEKEKEDCIIRYNQEDNPFGHQVPLQH